MSSPDTRERWVEVLSERARAHWTPERQRGLWGEKNLLLPPIEAAVLLRVLGLLDRDASMSPKSVRKYMQINHMVALLEPIMRDLARRHATVRILDAGCGSSYLTLLLAWCFKHRWHHRAEILGVDRNARVIAKCRRKAPLAQLEALLRFEVASIGSFDLSSTWARAFGPAPTSPTLHGLLALHACDTATDDALALGIRHAVNFIGVVPCCQAELSRKWETLAAREAAGAFAPIWTSPHLRRTAGATLTDALRMLLLRSAGYDVTPMEFVPSEHTPKNTLLRATRGRVDTTRAFEAYQALKATLGGVTLGLEAVVVDPREQRVDPNGGWTRPVD